jgi:hypothetical protein
MAYVCYNSLDIGGGGSLSIKDGLEELMVHWGAWLIVVLEKGW